MAITTTRTDTAAATDTTASERRASAPPGSPTWVTLAHLVRPQGRHGELLADILTDFPERFSERRRLFLQQPASNAPEREVALAEHRLHKDRLVLKFAGVDSIEQAEALRGLDVVIPREERAPLDEDSVYISDLAGCLLFDRASSRVVGEILDIDRESANLPLIVVRSHGGGEVLVPFAKAYAPVIDLGGRRMEMTLPEGLLTLDASAAEDEFAASDAPHPEALTPLSTKAQVAATATPPHGRSKRRRKPRA